MSHPPRMLTALTLSLGSLLSQSAHATPCEALLYRDDASIPLADAAAQAGLEATATSRLLSTLSVRGECSAIGDFAITFDLARSPMTRFTPAAATATDGSGIGPGALGAAFDLTGSGIDIAIIDTGLDYLHPALGGSGAESDYAGNDPTLLDLPLPPHIRGYDLAGRDGNSPDPDPFPDATSLSDPKSPAHHGTALASLVHAIAPEATLSAYKILGEDEREARLDTLLSALERAVDPNDDGAFDDAPDILLLAWEGLDEGPGAAPLALALDTLSDRGVLVITPAGNRGGAPLGLAGPCAVSSTLCVAASYPDDLALPTLEVTDPPYLKGTYPILSAPIGLGLPTSTRRIARLSNAGDACNLTTELPNLLSEIALFTAHDCDLAPAIAAASDAQAEAILFIAPHRSLELWQPQGESGLDIPIGLISSELGEDLLRGLSQELDIEVTLSGRPVTIDNIGKALTSFTARGPSHLLDSQPSEFLSLGAGPDLAAPGYGITAALAGLGSRTARFSGTSFSAAHAAGVLALLRQHTKASPSALTSLATQSARPVQASPRPFTTTRDEAPLRAPITLGGAGLLDLERALNLADSAVLIDESVLALGVVQASQVGDITKNFTLRNNSESPVILDSELMIRDTRDLARGVTLELTPTRLELAPGESATVSLHLTSDPRRFEPWRLRPETQWSADPSYSDRLTDSEIDGFIRFAGGLVDLSLPFTLLPRATSHIHSEASCLVPEHFDLTLHNDALNKGPTELFTLGATDPVEQNLAPHLDLAAAGIRYAPYGDGHLLELAISTHGTAIGPDRTLALVTLDTDLDGEPDKALANLPDDLVTAGLPSGASRSFVLTPNPEGLLDLGPAGRYDLGTALYTRVDLVGRSRILTAEALDLGITGTRPFDWRVVLFDVEGAIAETDVLPSDTADDRLTFDPTCAGWTFDNASVLTEDYTRIKLVRAPSCEFSGRDGVLAVHLGNPDTSDFEALTPPTEANYTCAPEMIARADFETCDTNPRFTDFIEGSCADSALVEGDKPKYPLGSTPATLQITDYWGHKTSCTTEIVVEDLTPPVVDCGEVDRIGADWGMLPYRHEVSAFDNCTTATSKVVGWRCLIHEGSELRYDVSNTCDITLDGSNSLYMRDLGRIATLVEWTVVATDESGNEEATACYSYIDRDLIQAVGGSGCSSGHLGPLSLGLLSLAALAFRRSGHRTE
jgi:subtilisin family serine protease